MCHRQASIPQLNLQATIGHILSHYLIVTILELMSLVSAVYICVY